MWLLAIGAGFRAQKGFKSIDENSKFEVEKTDGDNKNVESMMF